MTDTERPLVTFALFAYNQEKYIREAIEGAFAQTYSPLEIIISDDCSEDRTFQIISAMARTYKGPHEVTVARMASNVGTMRHVLGVASKARGNLIVMAAGDDISLPERVEHLYNAWAANSAWGLYSRLNRIDDAGNLESVNCLIDMPGNTMRRYFNDGASMHIILGTTSAYDKRAFSLIQGPINTNYEDSVMSFVLHACDKKVCFVDQTLVHYRSHPDSMSNAPISAISRAAIVDWETKSSLRAKSLENMNTFCLRFIDTLDHSEFPGTRSKVKRNEIELQIRFLSMMSRWMDVDVLTRACFLLGARRWTDARWMLPRLLGLEPFILVKRLAHWARSQMSRGVWFPL